MKILTLVLIISSLVIFSCSKMNSTEMYNITQSEENENLEIATLAGGCFWCMETPFENIDGVEKVISGYSGGTEKNPSYKEVSSGGTGHLESVQIYFNPNIISYSEILDIYWKQFDPTDAGGSFYDRGNQYTSAIFYHNNYQKEIAEMSKNTLDKSGLFTKKIVTKIEKFNTFYPAEDYHQDFYLKDPNRYKSYRKGSGRDTFIEDIWKNKMSDLNVDKSKLKSKLSKMQYYVTQENGTERAFDNEYWDNKEKGIYVDIVDSVPLFSSNDKFKSGTGWPSFTKPIDTRNIKKVVDKSHSMIRVEVRSKIADSHLGHIFNDGPAPTNLRYCLNSASLKFIPLNKMKEEGFGDYLWLFKN